MKQYFDLAIACLLFSTQFVFTKTFSKRSAGNLHAGVWNGTAISFFMLCYLLPLNAFTFSFSRSALICAGIYTLCSIGMTMINVVTMRLGEMSIVTTYVLLGGMVLPFIFGVMVLDETCSAYKIIAIIILMLSLVPPLLAGLGKKQDLSEDDKAKKGGKKQLLFHALCLILFLFNGFISIITKVHTISEDAIEPCAFTMLCATMQLAVLFLTLLAMSIVTGVRKTEKTMPDAFRKVFLQPTKEKTVGMKMFFLLLACSFGYALCNGVANIFSQSCAKTMDSSVQFPVLSAVVIILTALLGKIFFGEKIKRANAISLLLSCAGIALFMIG